MKSKFHFGALIISVIVGFAIVMLFSRVSGGQYSTPLFPVLALLSGFIVTGFVIGITTKGVTILEPGLGSIIVAILTHLILPSFNLHGFEGIWHSDWLLIFMNAIVLTFIGSWLGEKFQHGVVESNTGTSLPIDWGWIVAGTMVGLTVSLIMLNILVFIYFLLGESPSGFFIPFFIALFCTGILIGWKSPGVTIKEAGIAGFLTITLDLNLARLTLNTVDEIGVGYIIAGLSIGFVVTLIGGFLGEQIQSSQEKKIPIHEPD